MKLHATMLTVTAMILALALCGCNADGARPPAGGQVSPVEAARDAAAASPNEPAQSGASTPTNDYVAPSSCTYDDAAIDVDLTKMSSTAVYSTVYQMMNNPRPYQGKLVKMQGTYYSQYDEETSQRHYFVIVKDATACCTQGIEFIWDDGGHAYPDDYPEEGAEAIVCGKFGTFAERSSKFAYLSKASLALAS